MSAYVVVDLNIRDREPFMEYVSQVTALIEKHGGRYLVQGAVPEVLHGSEVPPAHVVVIEFADIDVARAFFRERAELGLADLFAGATDSRILLVEGARG